MAKVDTWEYNIINNGQENCNIVPLGGKETTALMDMSPYPVE